MAPNTIQQHVYSSPHTQIPLAGVICKQVATAAAPITRRAVVVGGAVACVVALGALAIKVLDTPSRPYDADANTVGNEYDAWTEVRSRVCVCVWLCAMYVYVYVRVRVVL